MAVWQFLCWPVAVLLVRWYSLCWPVYVLLVSGTPYVGQYLCNELEGGRHRLIGLSGFPKEQQTHSGDGI